MPNPTVQIPPKYPSIHNLSHGKIVWGMGTKISALNDALMNHVAIRRISFAAPVLGSFRVDRNNLRLVTRLARPPEK